MDVKVLLCEICNSPMLDENSKQSHLRGKKHQLALHNKHISDVKVKCSIYVSNIPNQAPKAVIQNFFSLYGQIVDFFLGDKNKFAIIQFKEEEVAKKLIAENPYFLGRKLLVKPRKLQENNGAVVLNTTDSLFSSLTIIESLKSKKIFDEEINALISIMVEPRDIVRSYNQLCNDLRLALSSEFPGCRVHPFGSTITGLDLKGSDVDAHVAVQRHPSVTQENLVRRAKNILLKNRLFTKVIAIPSAKTPIVKCVHSPTNIACDFNFKNFLGVSNSCLIQHYLTAGKNLKPTLILLKCWAKFHDLIGSSGKFSSYALIMMFIFYLQHPPFNVTPVKILQIGFMNMIDLWNGIFNNQILLHNNRNLEVITIQNLILGFFKFYVNFEFSIHIISPFEGAPVPKSSFQHNLNLPLSFNLYRYNIGVHDVAPLRVDTPICVQDPFELNHNTTRGVTAKTLEEFIQLCRHGIVILTSNDATVYRLLTEEGTCQKFSISESKCEFKVLMGSNLKYLDDKLDKDVNKEAMQLQKAWFTSVNQFFYNCLVKILKFDCNFELDGAPTKIRKIDNSDDVYNNAPYETMKYHCTGKYNLWQIRKSVCNDIVFDDNAKTIIDKQIYITNYICNTLLKGIDTNENIIDCYVTLNSRIKPTCMEVIVERNDLTTLHNFKMFAQFFAMRLPQWFETHERELNTTASSKKTNEVAATSTKSIEIITIDD